MKDSKILKIACYILIPVIVLILALSIFYNVEKNHLETRYQSNSKEYFSTNAFLSEYMHFLSSQTSKLIYRNNSYNKIQDENFKICYVDSRNYLIDCYFLIIYNNLAITNVELTTNTNTIQNIKEYISNIEGKKANIVNGVVQADSELISQKALQYFNAFNYSYYSIDDPELEPEDFFEVEEYEIVETPETTETIITPYEVQENRKYYQTSIESFEIYSTYKEVIEKNSYEKIVEEFLKSLQNYEKETLFAIPVLSVFLLIIIIYLIISIGHTKDIEGIDLNDLDKIPIDILLGILLIIIIILALVFKEAYCYVENYYKLAISGFIAVYFATYIVCMLAFVTIIKRIKSKTLIKNSIIIKLWDFCLKIIKEIFIKAKKVYKEFARGINTNVKLFIGVTCYCIFAVLMIGFFEEVGAFIDIAILVYGFYKFIERENCSNAIKTHLKDMYEGKEVENLKTSDFTPEFKDVVISINDISNGFENAKQEGIKSERMKTELITNVSHDIKTPLTSIINYVDLLKKEDIKNQKAKEYIDILDQKSQRLKKLTEDLVEASKASSGNVKLNIEKINITELIKQTIGEFEDRFKEKKLEIISTIPKEDIYINADSRYMYRIIENLFSNISKYALNSSRVYIDIKNEGLKVVIVLKNISKEKLNITAEELMQRFVRGDKSRNTEGSGLGLSISQSLTELQNGQFKLNVDGDLFKVELEFSKIK